MQKMRCERKKQKKEKRKNNINVQKLQHLTSVENDMKPERNLIESTCETPDII